MGRVISEDEFKEIKKLYLGGSSLTSIGKKLNRCHGVISYCLRKRGVKIDTPLGRAERRIPTQVLVDMYESGMSLPEIGEEVGFTAQGVHDRLLKTKVRIRPISEAVKNSYNTGRSVPQTGENHHSWKGGRYINENGYVELRVNKEIVLEHRQVWESVHGEIPKGWVVHHLNGIKLDNRIENIQAMPRKHHSPMAITYPYQKRIVELENKLKRFEKGE